MTAALQQAQLRVDSSKEALILDLNVLSHD